MSQGSKAGWLGRGAIRYVVAALLALEALAVVLFLVRERASRREDRERIASSPIPDSWSRENLGKPIVRPPTVAAEGAAIADDEEVIGVEVNGEARAYRLGALSEPSSHLVQDVIGGVPVSVVYCDLTDCAQAFTEAEGAAPLDLQIAGVIDGGMVVIIGGVYYYQKSGTPVESGGNVPAAPPFRLLTPARMDWKSWVGRHPGTDVYVGDRRQLPRGRGGQRRDLKAPGPGGPAASRDPGPPTPPRPQPGP